MPQAASLTSPRLPISLVALAFTLFAWPVGATEIESAYSKLELGRCKDVTLVVTKLGTDDACHMAYVDATNNPEANEQARAIADTEAASFTCKKDKAKHSGIGSQ